MNDALQEANGERKTGRQSFLENIQSHPGYFLAAILIIGAFLRFYQLGARSLWFDEVITLDEAQERYRLWSKTHLLYFLMVRFFLNFGHTEFWLRFNSALFGALGVWAIYLVGKEVFRDRRVGLVAALLIALSRAHINFSQEARYYSVMFFLTAISLYLYATFLNKHSLVSLILLPLVCLVNFLNHITSLVFSGLLLLWLSFSMVVSRQGRDTLMRWWGTVGEVFKPPRYIHKPSESRKTRQKRRSNSPGARRRSPSRLVIQLGALVLILALLCVSSWAVWKMGNAIYYQSKHIRLYAAPAEGVRADFAFFFNDHFLLYGPVVRPNTPLRLYIVALFIVFSVVGYGRALVRHFSFAAFCLITLFVTFTLLFSVPVKQIYSPKYIFFVFPANIACISYGFISVVDFLRRLFVRLFHANPLWVNAILLSAFLVPEIGKDIQQVAHLYRGPMIDVKSAVRDVAQQFGKDDCIAAYGLTSGTVRYYVDYYSLPRTNYQNLEVEKGDGTRAVHRLLKSATRGGNIWFIYGWQFDMRPYLKAWVEQNFTPVQTYPSIGARVYDVTVWKWKYKGALLSEETTIPLPLSFLPHSKTSSEAHPPNVLAAEKEVFAYHDMEAVLRYSGVGDDLPSSFSLEVLCDGTHAGGMQRSVEHDLRSASTPQANLSVTTHLPFGAHRLTVVLKSGDTAWQGKLGGEFVLQPANPSRRFIYAVDYDRSSESYEIECKTENNTSYLFMPINGFSAYGIRVDASGTYALGVRAKNDAPIPINYHIEIDDVPRGIISFFKADDSWESHQFPVALEAGEHTISLYFVSDVFTEARAPSENTDSYVSHLYVEKADGGTAVKDQRRYIPESSVVPMGKSLPANRLAISENEHVGWQAIGFAKAANETITVHGRSYDALGADVAFDSGIAGFLSPQIPVQPNQIAYFTIKVSVENLGNHSASVILHVFDGAGKRLASRWLGAQGLTGTVRDAEFICLTGMPPNAAAALIEFAVYPNSTRPFAKTGTVWFYDFRSDVDLTRNF